MQEQSYKYWAFISYSHRDQAWAEWLHRALETYRVPRRLVGRDSPAGPLPRRLFPIFRDQEELPSSPNLSAAIDQALSQSRYLIVIASPYAAVSKWVDQEIARFRALGRDDRIFCLIVDGEPHADLQPGRGLLECFPPSLRARGMEPIAADVRPVKDSKSSARLKLIAGLLGIGLDELRRRERRRRILQRLGWTAAGLLAASTLMALWLAQQHEKKRALEQQALRTHIEAVYEKGRQELIAHNQARAAVYLNEAYLLGVDTPALRLMLGRAMRIVESEKLSFQTGSAVSAVRFSPDSKLLVTTGVDETARVWDAALARKLFEFPVVSSGRSLSPRFSRDSRLVYVVSAPNNSTKGVFKVWDVGSGHLIADLRTPPNTEHTFNAFDRGGQRVGYVTPEHAAEIADLQSGHVLRHIEGNFSVAGFSRDGRRFFTGTDDGEVAIWDGDGRRRLQLLHGLGNHVVGIDDSEDGALVAAAARDGSVRVWRWRDGKVQVVAGHPSPNPSLIFNPDGTRLLTKANDGARLWNTLNGQLVYVQQFAGAASNRFDISSSGRWVLSSGSSRLAMQDAQSGIELFTLDGHRGLPEARDISEDDQMIATGGPDGRVVLWNMPGFPDYEFRHHVDLVRWASETRPPAVAAVYSHAGNLVATAAGDGRLKLWDAASHQLLKEIQADTNAVNAIAFAADDASVVTGGYSDGVRLWDTQSGRLLHQFNCDGRRVLTVAYAADHKTVAAAVLGGITFLWDADSGERIASFDRDEARAAEFSPDGSLFAIGTHQSVRLWQVNQRKFLWSTALYGDSSGGEKEDIAALDFGGDGRQLLVAGYGRHAFLLDSRTGQIMQSISDPSIGRLNSARLDSAHTQAVMADDNGGALLWWPSKGKSVVLRAHAGGVRSADFSGDGSFVLTSAGDATARIWDAANGELLDLVAEHGSQMPEAPFQAAGFSPDGRWVLTGSTDGAVRLWGLRMEQRSPKQIDAELKCRVPWILDGDSLVASTPGDSACAQP